MAFAALRVDRVLMVDAPLMGEGPRPQGRSIPDDVGARFQAFGYPVVRGAHDRTHSIRARFDPRQRCGPPPKARWRISPRVMSSWSALGKPIGVYVNRRERDGHTV